MSWLFYNITCINVFSPSLWYFLHISFYILHFIHPSFLPSCLIYFFFLSFFSFLPCLLACFLLSSSFVKFSVRQSFLVFEYYFNKPSASKRLVRFRTIPLTGLSDSSSAPNDHERSLVTCWYNIALMISHQLCGCTQYVRSS